MASNLKPPSDRTIKFLYDGVLAFYPDVAKDVFSLGRISLPYHEAWGGFKRLDFLELALNTTTSDSIDDAARTIKSWREGKGVERTVPEKLDEMVASLEEKEAKMAAYEKQKLAKEALLESQRAKEAAPEIKPAPAVVEKVVAVTEKTIAPPEAEPTIGIQITPQAGRVLEKFTNRIASAPVRAAVAFAGPTIAAQEGGMAASSLTLWARGIKSESLEKEASKLDAKEAKKFNDLIKAIKGIETSHSLQTRIIQRSFPIKDLSLFMQAGATQAQVQVFFNPPEAGGVAAVPRRSFLGNLLVGAGQQLLGKLSAKAVSGLAGKAAGAVTAKAAGAGIGTAVGGPVGSAVGYAVGWISNKVVGKALDFLREHRDVAYALLFVPVAGAGLIFGIPVLTVAGGVGMAVSLTGGTGAAVSGIGGALGSFFGALPSLFVTAIATPVIVALISIPVIVALILFIINSGAYIVPPLPSSAVAENPYIGVVKEVEPAGPFENSDLPISVTYTITVTAKRGTLTNVSFEHKCEVLGENSNTSCPAPLPDTTPTEISSVKPFVYSYSQTYSGSSYQDSLVTNSFTVSADAPEAKGQSATGLASIIIGNPPTGCYNVAGSWPSGERGSILAAISNLIGRAPTYVARVCAAYSQVNLYYDPPKVCGAWGCAPGGNTIYFNSRGLTNLRNATFILAHESAHVLSYGNGSIFQAYRAYPGTLGELPVCSYGGSSDAEGFAEAIANYVVSSSCLSGNPNNIEFVEKYIFR
jgi:hypothetical protein